eukprot:6212700-Pleurochrysis_carterae.AAC.2
MSHAERRVRRRAPWAKPPPSPEEAPTIETEKKVTTDDDDDTATPPSRWARASAMDASDTFALLASEVDKKNQQHLSKGRRGKPRIDQEELAKYT